VLANLESFNAELLKRDTDKAPRYACLHKMSVRQLSRLNRLLRKVSENWKDGVFPFKNGKFLELFGFAIQTS
jgi:hypothetical protein